MKVITNKQTYKLRQLDCHTNGAVSDLSTSLVSYVVTKRTDGIGK